MQPKDWWYLIATIVSPFLAAGLTALLTLRWQDRTEKRAAKLRVFTTLMATRRNIQNFQVAQEWVKALNTIDVFFADCPEVLKHWRELYPMLQQQNAPPGQGHKIIELLSAMANHLGYKDLPQTVIDQGHFPTAVSGPVERSAELQSELIRVLKNTESLAIRAKNGPEPSDTQATDSKKNDRDLQKPSN